MNTLQKTLLAVIAGSVVSVSAQAALFSNAGYAGQPYIGVKAGQFMVDDDGADDLDDATAYGIYGGYNFDPNFGVEVEYVGSSDADVRVFDINGEYDVKTYGAYGTYRYYFPNTALYAKGKLGIAKTELNGNFDDGDSISASDTGIAGGIGLGYAINSDFGIEAEYAIVDSDINLLTVGAQLKF